MDRAEQVVHLVEALRTHADEAGRTRVVVAHRAGEPL